MELFEKYSQKFLWFGALIVSFGLRGNPTTSADYENLLKNIRQAHQLVWSKEQIQSEQVRDLQTQLNQIDSAFLYLKAQLQSELFAATQQQPLSYKRSAELASSVHLFLRALSSYSVLRIQAAAAEEKFSPLQFLKMFTLFVPFDVFVNISLTQEIEKGDFQNYHTTYIGKSYEFNEAKGFSITLNPMIFIGAESLYHFSKSPGDQSLFSLVKYVALRNLQRQEAWHGLMLNKELKTNFQWPTSPPIKHSSEVLPLVTQENENILTVTRLKETLKEQIKSLVLNPNTFNVKEYAEELLKTGGIQTTDPLFQEALLETSQRLTLNQGEWTLLWELFLERSFVPWTSLPENELKELVENIILRTWGAILFSRGSELVNGFNFGATPENLNPEQSALALESLVLKAQSQWRLELSNRLSAVQIPSIADPEKSNFRAYLRAEERDAHFKNLIQVAVKSANSLGASLDQRWKATLYTLKGIYLKNSASSTAQSRLPEALTELLESFETGPSFSSLRTAYLSSKNSLENEKQALQKLFQLKDSTKRQVSNSHFQASLMTIERDLAAWKSFAETFHLENPLFQSDLSQEKLKTSPELLLHTVDKKEHSLRLAQQKDRLTEMTLEPYPLLQHKVSQSESQIPLYLYLAQQIQQGKPLSEIKQNIHHSIEDAQRSLEKSRAKILAAQSLIDLETLALSPSIHKEMAYLVPQFRTLQRLWIDEVSSGDFHKRYYESVSSKTTQAIIFPLLGMLVYEFFSDRVTQPSMKKPDTITFRKAFFKNWRDSIHPIFWAMIIGNLVYRDSQNLYKYGLGYELGWNEEKLRMELEPSKKHTHLETLFESSSVGNPLVSSAYYQYLKSEYIQKQTINHVVLIWDSVLAAALLRGFYSPHRQQNLFRDEGGGIKVKNPEPPGPQPPSKLQIDLKSGEIRATR